MCCIFCSRSLQENVLVFGLYQEAFSRPANDAFSVSYYIGEVKSGKGGKNSLGMEAPTAHKCSLRTSAQENFQMRSMQLKIAPL